MSVAFDAKPTGTSPAFDVVFAGVTSVNLTTMTVGTGANRLLLSGLTFDANVSISAVTWDNGGTNQAMTQIGTAHSTTNDCYNYFHGVVAPTSGNKTLAVSWTTAADGYCSTTSWTGANQTFASAFINFTSSTDTAPGSVSSISVTSDSSSAAAVWGGNKGVAGWLSQTQTLWSADSGGVPNQWASYAVGVVNPTFSTTLTGTGDNNVTIGVSIAPPSAAVTQVQDSTSRLLTGMGI